MGDVGACYYMPIATFSYELTGIQSLLWFSWLQFGIGVLEAKAILELLNHSQ
jgi:hypothetical protein